MRYVQAGKAESENPHAKREDGKGGIVLERDAAARANTQSKVAKTHEAKLTGWRCLRQSR